MDNINHMTIYAWNYFSIKKTINSQDLFDFE